MIRFEMPEPGLSRAARWCLLLDATLLVLLLLSMWPNSWEQWRPPVELAVARTRSEDGPNPEDDRVILTVTRDGRAWRAQEVLDAARLGDWLNERVLAYDERRRAEGKSGFEDFPGAACASRLHVVLRIDRATPWGAVHDILRRVGQASLYKVEFLVANEPRGRCEMQAFLPTEDLDHDYITARVRAGSITIDGHDVPDLTEAIRAAPRDYDRAVAGLIDADRGVPFGDVVRALDAFSGAGVAKVDLAADSARAVVVPRPR